jgi:hypothetical protein
MVQIAEQVTAPETIEATLSYFIETEAMPVTLVGEPAGATSEVGGNRTPPGRNPQRPARGRPFCA